MMEIEIHERSLEPEAWIEQADGLYLAAEALGSELQAEFDEPRSFNHRVRMLGLTRGYMLLIGAAFENSLKAIAVARDYLSIIDGKLAFDKVLRGSRNHSLPELASSLDLRLSVNEKDLLARSAAYLRWAARYPSAMKIRGSVADRGDHLLSVKSSDFELAKVLSKRLSAIARDSPK